MTLNFLNIFTVFMVLFAVIDITGSIPIILEVRKKIVPILNQAGIDLMVCGHTHHYSFQAPKDGENNFPILVSDNISRVDLSIDKTGIKVTRVDMDSKEISSMFFGKND